MRKKRAATQNMRLEKTGIAGKANLRFLCCAGAGFGYVRTMFFKKRKPSDFQLKLPTDRLHELFTHEIWPALSDLDAEYVKSLRALRIRNDKFEFEIGWDQSRFNTRQNDTRFDLRPAIFSKAYREWERDYYGLKYYKSPLWTSPYQKIEDFDDRYIKSGAYEMTEDNHTKIGSVIVANVRRHLEQHFTAFQGFDERAIAKLMQTPKQRFESRDCLIVTDFYILQDRHVEALTFLQNNNDWFEKKLPDIYQKRAEPLPEDTIRPYRLRMEKLAQIAAS